MSWEKCTLADIVTIKKGEYITKKDAVSGNYPVILGGKEPAYYINKYNHVGKAIVISRSGASAGYVSFWNEPIFITDGFLIEPKQNTTHKFLFYLLKSKQSELSGIQRGAAIPHVTPSLINSINISLPDLHMQNRIASILSAYDDLIENNQKQIKLLEEAAQRLYKEWFVDLRFPGWENTKIVDGVPEGWERLPLPQIADIQYGFAFDGSLFNSSGYGTPIVRIRNIPDAETSDFTSEEASSEYLINNGDIIVGMDGEFHINSWAGGQAYLVQRTCCIRPKIEKMRGWLLYSIHEPIKYFEKTIVGATVAHLGKKHLDSITLLVPTEELYAPFISIFDKRQILMEENIKLREVRDRLIYMLMSTN